MIKILMLLILALLCNACGRKSAIDSGDYEGSPKAFKNNRLKSAIVYKIPRKNWWHEKELKKINAPHTEFDLSVSQSILAKSNQIYRSDLDTTRVQGNWLVILENEAGKKFMFLIGASHKSSTKQYYGITTFRDQWQIEDKDFKITNILRTLN